MRVLKKIIKIREVPLDRVKLRLIFSKDFNLNISKAGILSRELKDFYPREPNLVLLPLLKPGQEIDLPPMGTLRFSNDVQNSIEFGKNFLIFIFTEYYDWNQLKNKILEIISRLIKSLDLKQIIQLEFTYIDKFILQREDFRFKDYFTLNFNIPENWDILPHDIFVGIVPYQEDNIKIILRLRNLNVKNKEELGFTLETVYIHRKAFINLEEGKLESILTNAHDWMEQYFIEFLTEEYKNKLGMEIK